MTGTLSARGEPRNWEAHPRPPVPTRQPEAGEYPLGSAIRSKTCTKAGPPRAGKAQHNSLPRLADPFGSDHGHGLAHRVLVFRFSGLEFTTTAMGYII